jgi:hypothetical protein
LVETAVNAGKSEDEIGAALAGWNERRIP